MNIIQVLESEQMSAVTSKRVVPEFGPGDTVRVMVKVIEGDNVRTQAYHVSQFELDRYLKTW